MRGNRRPAPTSSSRRPFCSTFFFFNDTATTEIYTLSLHDALPILRSGQRRRYRSHIPDPRRLPCEANHRGECRCGSDRKSTRLNSSHGYISYAVFCLKKKRHWSSTPCAWEEERNTALSFTTPLW